MEIYNNAFEKCNFVGGCMKNFFGREADFPQARHLLQPRQGRACTFFKVMSGPGTRMPPGVSQGDLYFEGEMWIKIEIEG